MEPSSDSASLSGNLTHSIHIIQDCEQPRNNFIVILIRSGHVLMHSDLSEKAISNDHEVLQKNSSYVSWGFHQLTSIPLLLPATVG
jgi:hypothetical protein